ncbi:MAG: tetratricopeptide repeat protein [Acidimicrobiales bacterium]
MADHASEYGVDRGPNVERAYALLDLGRYPDAERELRAAIGADPGSADLVTALALCRFRRNDQKGAYDLARKALSLDPQNVGALRIRAAGEIAARHYKRAHATLDEAVALDPSAATLVNRAEILRTWAAERRVDRELHRRMALDDVNRALALEPDNTLVHVTAARIYLTGPVDLVRAEEAARAALAIDADHGHAHELLGQVHEHRGQVRDAADQYVRAGRANPNDVTPTARIRQLGSRPSLVGPVAVFAIIRLLTVGGTSGWLAYLTAALVAAGLVTWIVANRRRQRRIRASLSADARRAIEVSDTTAQPAYRPARRRRW